MRVGSTLYYVLKDHLGSSSVVTDNTGLIVGEDRFYPFGETRFTTGTMFTDKLFTGQRQITGLGIYHYGARFYSPKLGRFLSADTIVPGYANPQNLNRYTYVTNNPLRYIDPTGHRPEDGYAGTNGCSNPKYCSNGKPKSKQELARMRRERRNDNGGGGGSITPTSTPTPSTTPTPQPVQTPEPSDIPAYTTSSTDWAVSDYYYEYGDWSSEPYGFPMEIGINAGGGVGQFSFSIGGHEISLPVSSVG